MPGSPLARKFAIRPGHRVVAIAPGGLLWISYPKLTSAERSDITRAMLRAVLQGAGWEAVSQVAVDDTWSATGFKPGRQSGAE